jgi:hypothetical protein
VAERKWHDSQRVQEKADGSIILELELGGLEEIERWILSWGKHARVLAPKELATRIRDEASAILKLYEASELLCLLRPIPGDVKGVKPSALRPRGAERTALSLVEVGNVP